MFWWAADLLSLLGVAARPRLGGRGLWRKRWLIVWGLRAVCALQQDCWKSYQTSGEAHPDTCLPGILAVPMGVGSSQPVQSSGLRDSPSWRDHSPLFSRCPSPCVLSLCKVFMPLHCSLFFTWLTQHKMGGTQAVWTVHKSGLNKATWQREDYTLFCRVGTSPLCSPGASRLTLNGDEIWEWLARQRHLEMEKLTKRWLQFLKTVGRKGLKIQSIIFLSYFLQVLQCQLHGILSNQQVSEWNIWNTLIFHSKLAANIFSIYSFQLLFYYL